MQEFIEKLIERLKEKEQILLDNTKDIGCTIGIVNAMKCSKEIVNQLAEEYKPKTQADKIRAMSDEELAIFLVNFKNTFGEEYEGEMSCLDWLQSEAE